MADVDERIRAVLDLGDSSGVVKGLDREMEGLLASIKKINEEFDQKKVSPRQYAESLAKIKDELRELDRLKKEVAVGGGGFGLDEVNRRLFALERGVSGIVSGTGLGRAGAALESGIGIFGGPAGLGIMAALITNTIDNVGPKIKDALDKMFKGVTEAEIASRKAALTEEAAQLRAAVKSQEAQPKPGLEYEQAERDVKLRSIFTGKAAPDLISRRLFETIRGHPGATISDIQPEEKEALERIRAQLFPGRAQKEAFAQGTYQGLFQSVQGLGEAFMQTIQPRRLADLQLERSRIKTAIAQRTADKLIQTAQQPGPEGRIARKQLLDLAKRFPGTLDPSDMSLLEDIIKQEDPERVKDELEKLQEERQKGEALEYKGPPPPVYPEFLHRGMAPKIPFGIIKGAEEAAAQRQMEREQGARGPVTGIPLLPPELGGPRPPRYRRTQPYAGDLKAQQAAYGEALHAAHQRQLEALKLEQQGLGVHAKTHSVVQDIQRLMHRLQREVQNANRNADNLLQRQQRSQQNTTGDP
jgi:uncharacterized protein YoxC